MTGTRLAVALIAAVGCLATEPTLSPLLRVKRVHIEKLAGRSVGRADSGHDYQRAAICGDVCGDGKSGQGRRLFAGFG